MYRRLPVFGAALDNQKAVTVKAPSSKTRGISTSTIRETTPSSKWRLAPTSAPSTRMSFWSAIRSNDAINLAPLSSHLDLGVIHYASDTPYTRAHTLGARGMSYYGMDSTYASTVAILQRIFRMEAERTAGPRDRPVSRLRTFVRVRFQECDPLGHVNNAVYISYLEQAAIDHAALAGWPADRLKSRGRGRLRRPPPRHRVSPARRSRTTSSKSSPGPTTMSGARAYRNYRVSRIEGNPYNLPASTLIDGAGPGRTRSLRRSSSRVAPNGRSSTPGAAGRSASRNSWSVIS